MSAARAGANCAAMQRSKCSQGLVRGRRIALGLVLLVAGGCQSGELANEKGVVDVVEGAASSTPAISLPKNGVVFKTTAVTFKWNSGAAEYWLRIGKSDGANDVYQSPSLGNANTLFVKDLPLDGKKLYVQLRSRFGTTYKTSTRTYTAAVRKGLCVVADFADRRLEDATAVGFRRMSDVTSMLS